MSNGNRLYGKQNNKKGEDKTGLGRWVWLLVEGRENKKVRIVRPSQTNNKENPVMQQHYINLTGKGRVEDNGNIVNPKEAFY